MLNKKNGLLNVVENLAIYDLVLLAFLASAIYWGYQTNEKLSIDYEIANRANEYSPLMVECLEKRSTIECLGYLKLVADKETFEATKELAIQRSNND